jgi:hypothetical protein
MKRLLIFPLLFLLVAANPAQSQNDLTIVLKTTPPAAEIGPDSTFTKTTLTVVDGNGRAAPNSFLKFHLDAPAGNAFISTDFPIVEGTPLIEYEGVLPNGVLEFSYIYPIRGLYNFEAEAGRNATTLTYKDTLSLTLTENRDEILFFAIFAALLLGFGIVAGFIIGRGAKAQQMAAGGAILLMGVGLLLSSTAIAQAHGGGDGSNAKPFIESATTGDLTVTYAMKPGAGRVGTLNTLTFSATDTHSQPVPDTTFDVAFWHSEDEKPVFATTLYAPTGEANLNFQFFDGAEHEVRLTARNTVGLAQLTRAIEVEGINPPLSAKIKTTIYLVLITFVGILIGLRIQTAQSKKQQFAPVGA